MSILSRIALPTLALALVAPVAMHAQSSGAPNASSMPSQTGNSTTAPQPKKMRNHHKVKSAPGSTLSAPSQPMPDGSMQGNPAIAKPGVDPINPNHSPEPPVPTTQGPPPAGTTPETNQVAPHM